MIGRRLLVASMVALLVAALAATPAAAQVEPSTTSSSPGSTVVAPADAVGEVDNNGSDGFRPDTGAGQSRDVVGQQAGGVPMLLAVLALFGVISLLAWRPWKRKPTDTSAKLGT